MQQVFAIHVCPLVEKKKMIFFSFEKKEFFVEPHCVFNEADLKPILRAWVHIPKDHEGWKDFPLQEISELRIPGQDFLRRRIDFDIKEREGRSIICVVR